MKYQIGAALREAQQGGKHDSAKPLHGFHGSNVTEIVASDADGTFRVVYTVEFRGAVYVLHAFQKKSRHGIATPKNEIDLVHTRLALAAEHHRQHYATPRGTRL